MQKLSRSIASQQTGKPIAGLTVVVKNYPAGTLATIYTTNVVGTPIANSSLTTDAYGTFECYAADGRYSVTISGSGYTTRTISDILIQDTQDESSSTFANITVSTAAGLPAPATVGGKQVANNPDLAANTGSSLIGFVQTGSGAIARTVQDKFRDTVYVTDFGAKGDGVTDDSVAIQNAINTGKTVVFTSGNFMAHGLTQSTNLQQLVGIGNSRIVKNANGDLISLSGNDIVLSNLLFSGDSSTPVFTGNNITITGERPTLINVGSQWAYGRALKATKNKVTIIGGQGNYQTADATASGYDIEIGSSGTATLYHHLENINSSQATGGILLTDVGSPTIVGGQYGKLTIASGTSPAGVNGGKIVGSRILGNVSVGLPSANFVGNQFGVVSVTFQVGTSLCSLDETNTFESGATVTNSGNGNNIIRKNISGASYPQIRFGDDSSTISLITPTASQDVEYIGSGLIIPNNKVYCTRSAAGVLSNLAYQDGSNNQWFGSLAGTFTTYQGNNLNLNSAAGTQVQIQDGYIRPASNATKYLGTDGYRWHTSFVYNGKTVTQYTLSDGRAVQNTVAQATATIAQSIASTYIATPAANITVTLDAPVADGERRRIAFGSATTVTWAVTSPATAVAGLPTTIIAGQVVEVVYNAVAGTPTNSAATTWYVY